MKRPIIHFVTGFNIFDYSVCGAQRGIGTRWWKNVTCKRCKKKRSEK